MRHLLLFVMFFIGSQSIVYSLSVDVTGHPIHCTGGYSSIAAFINNGQPPYSYQWSTGATAEEFILVSTTGDYSCTVTDMTGATASDSYLVIFQAITGSVTDEQPSCFDASAYYYPGSYTGAVWFLGGFNTSINATVNLWDSNGDYHFGYAIAYACDVAPGPYTFYVNEGGCTSQAFYGDLPAPQNATADITVTDDCSGSGFGQVEVNALSVDLEMWYEPVYLDDHFLELKNDATGYSAYLDCWGYTCYLPGPWVFSNVPVGNDYYLLLRTGGTGACAYGLSCFDTLDNDIDIATITYPSGISTVNITPATAKIVWTAVAGASSYRVKYRQQGTTQWTSVNAANPWKKLLNLLPATTYQVRVRSNCNGGQSAYSPVFTFTTQPLRNMADLPQAGLVVSPNPAGGKIFVSCPALNDEEVVINLFDLSGRNVFSRNISIFSSPQVISLPEELSGMFLLSLSGRQGIMTARVAVE